MQKNGRNGTPIYRKIQEGILRQIEKGQLRPGDAVDSERELARIHNVSLMTARHALATLERAGQVVRRRGAGTFIAPPKIHFNKLMSYTEQMSGRSLVPSTKVLACMIVTDQHEIAARLSLPGTSRLVKLERLRLGGEEPFALETCYLSGDEFEHLVDAPLDRVSLFSVLEHDYGIEIAHADEEIDATSSDHVTEKLLGLPRGTPILRIRQLIYSTKGKPIIYGFGLYRSDRHTLLIRRFR